MRNAVIVILIGSLLGGCFGGLYTTPETAGLDRMGAALGGIGAGMDGCCRPPMGAMAPPNPAMFAPSGGIQYSDVPMPTMQAPHGYDGGLGAAIGSNRPAGQSVGEAIQNYYAGHPQGW